MAEDPRMNKNMLTSLLMNITPDFSPLPFPKKGRLLVIEDVLETMTGDLNNFEENIDKKLDKIEEKVVEKLDKIEEKILFLVNSLI